MAKGTNLGWAKPDDPIYSSGPMISFRPQLTGSTSDTPTNTDGEQPAGSSVTPRKPVQPLTTSAQDDPMLPAIESIRQESDS